MSKITKEDIVYRNVHKMCYKFSDIEKLVELFHYIQENVMIIQNMKSSLLNHIRDRLINDHFLKKNVKDDWLETMLNDGLVYMKILYLSNDFFDKSLKTSKYLIAHRDDIIKDTELTDIVHTNIIRAHKLSSVDFSELYKYIFDKEISIPVGYP